MKTVYGAEGCWKCQDLKRSLESSNETFKYINISTLSKEELDKVIKQANGQMILPIVINN